MKTTLKKLFLGCTVALGGLTASAQGLQDIIVEEYHTITAADATLINDAGTQTDPIPVGATVYRVYVDMAPNYRFLSVTGGSTAQGIPLNFSTTTTFWNNDVLADAFPTQTRFQLQNGNAFDSYLTIHTTGKAGGSAPNCAAFGGGSSSNTQQVGVLRADDPNGNLTLCNAFSGFTANDGNLLVPFTITPSLSGFFTTTNFDAFTAAANTFTMVEDGFSLLPAVTGVDPAGTNRVLIGQFTTDGDFSFNINVALQSPGGVDEFYVYANPLASEQLSTALTYPGAACNAPVLGTPTSNGPLCAGQTLNLTSSATGDATITYSWAGPNTFSSTMQNPSIVGATTAATGTYTVTASNGCAPDASATVTVVVNAPANAGTNGTLTICAGSTVNAAQLFAQLGGTPNVGGTWSPAFAGAGVYTYTVTGIAPCTNATATVTVTEQAAPNAGTNGTLNICAGSTVNAAQLFAQLGGTPNAGGSWSPAFAGAGVYTYTVAAIAPCVGNATATVTVTEQAAPNAGTNGTLNICAGSTVNAAQLFAQLGGTPDAGGSWSPAFAGAGVYTYTVAATAPCVGNATATVTVTEQAAPNAGTNGTLSICSTAAAQDLFAQLGGTPDVGGTWSGPSTVVGGNYDPATMDAGVYTYTVAAIAPCVGNAIATVTVTETATGTWYQDLDGDLAGNPNVVLNQCDQPVGYVANNNDLCDNDANKIAPGACGCGVADVAATYYADTDGDGFGDPASPVAGFTCTTPNGTVADNTDNCPTLFGRQGDACNDNNASTNNDVITAACVCAGTPVGADDCEGVPDGPAQPGTPCDDNNATTGNDTWSATCQCVGLPFDCEGVAGGSALPGTPCDDGLATTGNDTWSGSCVCTGQVIDCLGVIGGTALPGTSCNDNNGLTTNDVYLANCTCQGTPIGGCTEIVSIEFDTDATPAQTSWEIIPEGGGAVVCSGAGNYAASTTITETCCLAQGCYALRVLDSAGDGITNGGYILTEQATGKRIIDNRDNFSTGSVSAISGVQGFCLPLGTDRLIATNCDKLSWITGQYLVATENTAVSATWIANGGNNVQPSNSGYEFWIFDPNGSYSFRRFRSHNVSDGRSPANALRACHMKINSWVNTVSTPHIPANVLMNVRVRGRVAGVNGVFGGACRMMVDPARAACPLTQLLNVAGNNNSSCGATRNYGNGNYVYAQPVNFIPAVSTSLVRYQFRFRSAGFEVIRQSNNYILPLNWTGSTALQCGVTYTVDVRVSKDGGATWCIDTPTPTVPFAPWGEVCTVTINPCAGTLAPVVAQSRLNVEGTLTMYPNPNRGDQLFISLTEVAANVHVATVDIFDMTGKRVAARTITVQDGFVNQSVELNGDLSGGLYMVNITAGDKTYTERLVIQP